MDLMPIITIEMLEGRTIEQKRELVSAITADMVHIAKADPPAVEIIIREMKKENFSRAGKLLCDP
jgi:4-oxalocrotonate tautomerase